MPSEIEKLEEQGRVYWPRKRELLGENDYLEEIKIEAPGLSPRDER